MSAQPTMAAGPASFPVGSGLTTDSQRELLAAARLGRDASLAYNEGTRLSVHSGLDVARLESALRALYRRHESLRMTFSRDNEAFFVWDRELIIERRAVVPSVDGSLSFDAAATELVSEPFDLDHGPLFRAVFLESEATTPGSAELVLLAHHAVCDGWSTGVLLQELLALYQAADAALSDPPSFVRYAAAVRAQDNAAADQFWQRQFAGLPPLMALPTPHTRAPSRDLRAGWIERDIPAAVMQQVQRTAAEHGNTTFGVLLAACSAWTQRLTAVDDLVMAVPTAGQAVAAMPELVGHCVHVLPIRVFVDPQQRVAELFRRVALRLAEAREHGTYTIGRLLQRVGLPRRSGHVPVTPIMFNLDREPAADAALREAGLEGTVRGVPRVAEYFELFVNLVQRQDGSCRLECQYNRSLFPEPVVREWLETLLAMLEQMVANPDGRVAALDARSADAVRRMRGEWQGIAQPLPPFASVAAWIADLATRDGEAIAVRHADLERSYRQLMEEADRVAQALRAAGVTRGSRVFCSVDRGLHLPAALLGAMRVGAAYVPVDPRQPATRIRTVMEDLRPAAWMHSGSLPASPARESIREVDVRTVATGDSAAAGDAQASPDDVVYVMPTSGSTGQPKYVEVTQANLLNFLAAMQAVLRCSATDRFLAHTPLTFDIAALELYLPLTLGASIVMVDADTARDGEQLAAVIASSAATVIQATPSTWRQLLAAGWRANRPTLAIAGGEALPSDISAQLRRAATRAFNAYGPTETTVWSTLHELVDDALPVSIGRPIANTSVSVEDAAGSPVAVGVPGELVIGGHGVARGYLGQPALSQERFVEDPRRPGFRRFRTGDTVAWQADGTLRFLGRRDDQVKLRGVRVELGEVESAFVGMPNVTDAAVRLWDDGAGDCRLAAYLVPSDGRTLDIARVRAALSERLPAALIPQHLVPVPSLPRTTNGKLDRQALPAPHGHVSAAVEWTGSWTPQERQVAEAWQAVLGVAIPSPAADFFVLGGHSILAARAVAQLEQRLNSRIGVRLLFEHSQLSEFARRLPTGESTDHWEVLTL